MRTPRSRLLLAVLLPLGAATVGLCLSQPEPPATEPTWTPLFNGVDLTGWEPTGNAKWTVQDGVLIGEQNQGQPGDLWTAEEYDNFELSVTFRMVWPGNSGIWFRCPGKQPGYQMDILDKQEYGVTVGTIYANGFLSRNEDESIVNLNDWNTVVILCDGPRLRVTLNGHETANLTDEQFATGRIGFQVHAGDHYAPMRIMVKECKLRRVLSEAEAQASAVNRQCFVCHVDYTEEPLTLTHQEQGVSCATCHGESKLHIDDEDRKTAPDRMIAHHKVAKFCRTCHTDIAAACPHAQPPADDEPERACTECHGKHKLEPDE
jgi:hypothetical protein